MLVYYSSILILLIIIPQSVDAVRCKCTKESETVTCTDGVCETELGSCLMLDHPTMGVHYTCHTKGMKDGNCHERVSKSGASVRICGCNNADFCNYSQWPDLEHHHKHHQHHHQKHHETEHQQQEAEAINSVNMYHYSLILVSIAIYFLF